MDKILNICEMSQYSPLTNEMAKETLHESQSLIKILKKMWLRESIFVIFLFVFLIRILDKKTIPYLIMQIIFMKINYTIQQKTPT